MAPNVDFQKINTAFIAYQNALLELKKAYPSTKPSRFPTDPCPEDPRALCKALNAWFKQYYAWALWVQGRIDPGPGDGVAPPPPPFG